MKLMSLLPLGLAAAVAACAAEEGARDIYLTPPSSMLVPEVATTAQEWLTKRGVFYSTSYGPGDVITFTYGSPESKTMSIDAFETFVRARLAGQTIATAKRPDLKSSDGASVEHVFYYSPEGRLADWQAGSGRPWLGKYEIKRADLDALRRGVPPLLFCIDYDQAVLNVRTGQRVSESCQPAYDAISGVHGKSAGDVFNLSSGAAPSILDPANPPTWPDGQPLIPDKAPHE